LRGTARTSHISLLSVTTVVLLGATNAMADDFAGCKASIKKAQADNRESGPNWVLIDGKLIVPADPRRAEDVRSWFEAFKSRDPAKKNLDRYRIVEFDAELLVDVLRGVTPPAAGAREFSSSPDLVMAPFSDRIYGLTVLTVSEATDSGRPTLAASGVLTNSYGVRGEWRLDVDLATNIVGLRVDSTEAVVQSFHPPSTSLVVLGETDRCRISQDMIQSKGNQ